MLETSDLVNKDPDAINEGRLHPQLITCASDHRFERQNGNEAKCVLCPLGYYLSPGMYIQEGHIMREGQLVL